MRKGQRTGNENRLQGMERHVILTGKREDFVTTSGGNYAER